MPFPVKRLGEERSILLGLKAFDTLEKRLLLLNKPTPLPLNRPANNAFFGYSFVSGLEVSSSFLTLTMLDYVNLTSCWQRCLQ